MNTQLIFKFLKDVAANNNRPWFAEHKEQYLAAKAEFEKGVEQAINALGAMDESVAPRMTTSRLSTAALFAAGEA